MTLIELALKTWYEPDNPKYLDPLHPTIKLAGEIGELLDLYAKHLFKPGVDWTKCKCGNSMKNDCHNGKLGQRVLLELECNGHYTPMVLDELGDIWYYLRILAMQSNVVFLLPDDWYLHDDLDCIKQMYQYASGLLYADMCEAEPALQEIYYYLTILLANLDCTIEQLTELNYQKLNSEPTAHGWKDVT